jgi:hypothetical protein
MKSAFKSALLAILPSLLFTSCCKMKIEQQCYRQGAASMVGDLGAYGTRAAGETMVKTFTRLGYTKTTGTEPLGVTIAKMKLVDTSKGSVTAEGNAVSEQISEIVKAGGSLTTSWDNQRSMAIRIFEFNNQIELIDALNDPQNARALSLLRHHGNEARIITRVVRAYDYSDIKKQNLDSSVSADLNATGSNVKLDVKSNSTSERVVEDGTVVGYQWSKIVWDPTDPTKVKMLRFDTTSWD